jgi:hypothetical protein
MNLFEGGITDSVEEQPVVTQEEVATAVAEAHIDSQVPVTPEVPVVEEPKSQYTPEEVKGIMASGEFDGIDTSRLSEEGQLVMRSMQAGLTPKLQEASELRKQQELLQEEVKSLREAQVAQKQTVEPQTVYEHFDADPDGTLQYIDGERRKLESQNGDGQFAENIRQLDKLENDLVRYESKKFRDTLNHQQQVASAYTALQQAVPGIETKQEALKDFALSYLGYTPNTLAQATDITTSGQSAVETIARINTAYEKINAVTLAKAKKVTPAPVKVETPGSGFETPVRDTYADKLKQAKAGEISWQEMLKEVSI